MDYVQNILNFVKKHGYSDKKLCELLGRSTSYITDWKSGKSKPKMDDLVLIAENFNISIDYLLGLSDGFLSSEEKHLLSRFRSLTDEGKDYVLKTVRIASAAFSSPAPAEIPRMYRIPLFDIPVSAGTGINIDYTSMQTMSVESPPPADADYALIVSGDSMSPQFSDGDTVYVEKTDSVSYGDIGIFVSGGTVYIKKYTKDGLLSINPAYPLIPASADIHCLGRVLGKKEQ